MAEFEAQFAEPEIRAKAGQLCKDCSTEPAFNPGCEDCRDDDGTCLRCGRCTEREGFRLAAGLLELLHRSTISGLRVDAAWAPIVDGLSRHGLMGVISALAILAYDPARKQADNGGVPVEQWLAAIRGEFG